MFCCSFVMLLFIHLMVDLMVLWSMSTPLSQHIRESLFKDTEQPVCLWCGFLWMHTFAFEWIYPRAGPQIKCSNASVAETRAHLITLTWSPFHNMSLLHRASQHILECVCGTQWLSLHLGDSWYDTPQCLLCISFCAKQTEPYCYWSADQYNINKNKQHLTIYVALD